MVVAMTTTARSASCRCTRRSCRTLAPGEIRLQYGEKANEWETFAISGGYLQVHEDKVIVLADEAVAASQIDASRARESKALIEQRLAALPEDAVDERAECERDLKWCELQIKAAEKKR